MLPENVNWEFLRPETGVTKKEDTVPQRIEALRKPNSPGVYLLCMSWVKNRY